MVNLFSFICGIVTCFSMFMAFGVISIIVKSKKYNKLKSEEFEYNKLLTHANYFAARAIEYRDTMIWYFRIGRNEDGIQCYIILMALLENAQKMIGKAKTDVEQSLEVVSNGKYRAKTDSSGTNKPT